MKKWTTILFVLILAATLVLRFLGLSFGFPYLFHPDEPTAVKRAVLFFRDGLNPRWFAMPSLYLYLLHFNYRIYGALTGIAHFESDQTALYLIGRIWSAFLGSATVGLVFLIGKRLFGRNAGLGAAALLAALPLHLLHSHYATVDVPMTFTLALALLFAARVLERGRSSDYLTAGICAGLSAGLKYNGVFAFVPILAACLLRAKGWGPSAAAPFDRKEWRRLGWAAIALVLVFFAVSPFILASPVQFLRDLKLQSGYLISYGHGPIFIDTKPGALYQLFNVLYYAGGGVFWSLSVAGVLAALVLRRKEDVLLLSFLIPYYILISIPTVKFSRFFIPLLPALALLAGRLLELSFPRLWMRKALAGLFAAGCLWIFLIGGGYVRMLVRPDARVEAKEWIESNLPRGTRLGMIRTETGLVFLDDPPLAVPHPFLSVERYPRLLPALAAKPDYLLATDFDYRDILRLREKYDIIRCHLWSKFLPGEAGYAKVREFYRPPAILGLTFGQPFAPHDMTYNCPRISLYRRLPENK
ncbi:MAG: glycosyltransferase family 39 protein [Candidatus Aureabacteria bacterium]|nr:glycosyltransferase family 39 protein [Candidatus Auribacterota bacterium]